MKVALIFPPQWDPRQAPLCIPTLAGVVNLEKHQVRAWDINLYLYWQNLLSSQNTHTLEQYLSPISLKSYKRFAKLSSAVEYEIYSTYDSTERHQLYWDNMIGPYSPDKSRDWMTAINNPYKFPFFKQIKQPLKEIIHWNPELVLISCISDTQIFGALSIAAEIRSKLNNALIVLGGHAMSHRRSLLKGQGWLFHTVDAICVSHGEPVVLALTEGKHLNKVPNIIWADKGVIKTSSIIESVQFNESFKPDFSVLPMEYYLAPTKVIPIETARGCPWSKCSFCGHPHMQIGMDNKKTQRIRSINSVIGEINQHLFKGFNKFFFVDEAIPYSRFKELCTALSRQKESLSWICYLRLEHSHDVETFHLAKKAGCKKVFFGLETGSGRLMKLHKKGSSPQIAQRVIKAASSAGIAVHLFMISEFPDESENDLKANYDLLIEILPFVDSFGFTYDVFPLSAELETPLYLYPEQFGSLGVIKNNNDLSYSFNLIKSKDADGNDTAATKHRINAIIENYLNRKGGVRHCDLSHDAMHLLLIDAKLDQKKDNIFASV